MLPAKLIVVNEVFEFPEVGLLIFLPPLPYALVNEAQLRAGDHLELHRPDGTVLQTTLYALDRTKPSAGFTAISIKLFTKADVPAGTEIWKAG